MDENPHKIQLVLSCTGAPLITVYQMMVLTQECRQDFLNILGGGKLLR